MKENETKENQGKFTDACDAPNLDKDHERLIRTRDVVIDSSKEVNLFSALGAKEDDWHISDRIGDALLHDFVK